MVISSRLQVHADSIWILRLILASVLSPLLYNFLDNHTAGWAIRAKYKFFRVSNPPILSISPSVIEKSSEGHFSNSELSRSR
jgi:hypothetical protein